jgi:hypothetical protein
MRTPTSTVTAIPQSVDAAPPAVVDETAVRALAAAHTIRLLRRIELAVRAGDSDAVVTLLPVLCDLYRTELTRYVTESSAAQDTDRLALVQAVTP